MPETIVLPPEDIRDFVAIQHDADGKIRVKVVEAKKHITSVQRYLTLLRSRYPGKISKFDFTTLDVIATLNSNNTERAPGVLSDGGINTVQRKVLDYIRKAAQLDASDLHITPGR
ncbi:type II secretion protein E, partial [Escherichia coli]|nr:type II secretion protein E [Escherichia coli]EFK2711790.1 type II secretion protein E [Escherichia coli]EGD9220534.1 type II secretion protein E [Escherichia coli]EHK3331589.1 type II secretion protein E [Escherichia coli]EHZ4158565.1 type II secretion protein E [Escherichia coli]